MFSHLTWSERLTIAGITMLTAFGAWGFLHSLFH